MGGGESRENTPFRISFLGGTSICACVQLYHSRLFSTLFHQKTVVKCVSNIDFQVRIIARV